MAPTSNTNLKQGEGRQGSLYRPCETTRFFNKNDPTKKAHGFVLGFPPWCRAPYHWLEPFRSGSKTIRRFLEPCAGFLPGSESAGYVEFCLTSK